MKEWQCIGHNPTTWALGTRQEDKLIKIIATVTRNPDGKWRWQTSKGPGVSPSREEAISDAEKNL